MEHDLMTDRVTTSEQGDKLIAELNSIVGRGNVSAGIFERIAYGHDALGADLAKDRIPLAVVKPGSAQEVSEVLKLANPMKLPILVHGAGTSFKGSPRPKRAGSIVLHTERLNSFELFEKDMYYEVGAGVNVADLEKALAEKGYFLPMNLGSKLSATIGGSVAVNTIGHMNDTCVGKIADYVMGLEVVLPTGGIIQTGTKSVRRPSGIDLTRFFVGSEGLFGVITRIRLRLVPMPKFAHVVGFFAEIEDAARAFQRIYWDKLVPPLYGELLAKDTAVPAFRTRGLGEPPGHMALATTMSPTQEEAGRQAREIERVFQLEKAIDAHVVVDRKEQEDLWQCRDFITNLRQREEGEPRKLRGGGFELGVPLSKLADFFTYIGSLPESYPALRQSTPLFYGHVGPSAPHVIWSLAPDISEAMQKQTSREIRRLEKEMTVGWEAIGGEVGQTASRMSAWRAKYGEDAFAVAMGFKKLVDPNNILNPGNLEGEGYED